MKPLALSTGKMAKYIGVSSDELKRLKREGIFKKDIHYTIPQGRTHPLWIVEKMEEWLLFSNQITNNIVEDILKNIK